MRLLMQYLRRHRGLVALALVLAAINQIFSLLDPLIFRYVIDDYATKYDQYTRQEFFRGVGLLLLAAMGVAFVSRVATNFQDYYINLITQRLGAELYSDGIDLPVFEEFGAGTAALHLRDQLERNELLTDTEMTVLTASCEQYESSTAYFPFRRLLREPRIIAIGLSSQLVALPLLTFALVSVVDPVPSIALGLMMTAACPGGNMSNVLTHWAGGRTSLSMAMTTISSLVSPVVTPLTFAVLGGFHPATREAIARAARVSSATT